SGAAGTSYGSWSIANASNASVLLVNDTDQEAGFASGVTFGGAVALRNAFTESSSGYLPYADDGTVTDAQIRAQLAPVRANAPSQDTSLPAGVMDLQLLRVRVLYGTTGIHIAPGN